MKGAPSRKRLKRGGGNSRRNNSSSPKILIFYHIFCNEHTMGIVWDQVKGIIFSGLCDDVHTINCFLTGEKKYIDEVKQFIETLPKKFHILEVGVDDKTFERFTLTKIASRVNDGDKILYMHTKGVLRTSGKNVAMESVYLWRIYIEYYMIRHYKRCLEKLDTHDVVGALYHDKMIGPHFSGNFWWVRGDYFKKLSKEHTIGQGYYDPESYIMKSNPRIYKMDKDSVPRDHCFYKTPYHLKNYVGDINKVG